MGCWEDQLLVGRWCSAYEICCEASRTGELYKFGSKTKLIIIGRSIDDTTSMAAPILSCTFNFILPVHQNADLAFDK